MTASQDVVILGGAVTRSSVAYILTEIPEFTSRVPVTKRDPTDRFVATSLASAPIRGQFSNVINLRISQRDPAFVQDVGKTMPVAGNGPRS